MAAALHFKQQRACRNQAERRAHLVRRAEGIAPAAYEQGRRRQFGEVRRPELRRLARRMQRIRKQKQSVDYLRIFGSQHGSLPSAIRVSAKKDTSGRLRPKPRHSPRQPFTVPRRRSRRRRPKRPSLPKRQITAQNREPGFGK